MDFIVDLGNYVTNMVLIAASGVATIMMLIVGYLWMFSGGDPRKVAMAKSAGMMVFIGMLIAGCAYMIPRIVNEQIVLPSGGQLQGVFSLGSPDMSFYKDCDEALRTRLERWQGPADYRQIQSLVDVIKAVVPGCEGDNWQLEIADDAVGSGNAGWSGVAFSQCFEPFVNFQGYTFYRMKDIVPYVWVGPNMEESRVSSHPVRFSERGYWGRAMIIYFDGSEHYGNGSGRGLPADRAVCWVYDSVFGGWHSGKPMPQQ